MTDVQITDEAKIGARKMREHTNIFARLSPLYAASRQQGQRLLQMGGGLSIVEWRTLWDLAEVGPMTIRDLAEVQRADHSLLSRALPEMRRKGYVTMTRDSRDGRQTIVTLTAEGRAAYDRAAPIMASRRAALREEFTEAEIQTFVDFLGRFEEFLRRPIETIIEDKEAAT
ncbi:winged helix DNA-binding protein [Rhodobacteraceae bacterium M385]|nr:winged helix DNA-binding protein [Rhodobacteraceae bacterium M385]